MAAAAAAADHAAPPAPGTVGTAGKPGTAAGTAAAARLLASAGTGNAAWRASPHFQTDPPRQHRQVSHDESSYSIPILVVIY